jgi:MFS-type transporter involved in bile tolerance (Atg22 family)
VAAARATGTMFNVAGVLLVLQRTGSLVLAGITVAAATLPGALTGPFLGAWLDVTTSRRRLLVVDRLLTTAALVALLLLAGHSRTGCCR